MVKLYERIYKEARLLERKAQPRDDFDTKEFHEGEGLLRPEFNLEKTGCPVWDLYIDENNSREVEELSNTFPNKADHNYKNIYEIWLLLNRFLKDRKGNSRMVYHEYVVEKSAGTVDYWYSIEFTCDNDNILIMYKESAPILKLFINNKRRSFMQTTPKNITITLRELGRYLDSHYFNLLINTNSVYYNDYLRYFWAIPTDKEELQQLTSKVERSVKKMRDTSWKNEDDKLSEPEKFANFIDGKTRDWKNV